MPWDPAKNPYAGLHAGNVQSKHILNHLIYIYIYIFTTFCTAYQSGQVVEFHMDLPLTLFNCLLFTITTSDVMKE